MDAIHFDTLVRCLTAVRSRRSALTAALGGILLMGVLPAAARKRKRRKVTLCHAGESIRVKKNKTKKHLRHGDTRGACPSCVPEPMATTCAGRCGSWVNNCGDLVTCRTCLSGQSCLANGSCATTCTAGTECATGCECSPNLSVEGERYCSGVVLCEGLQACSGTADCPRGEYCERTLCDGVADRCVPICTG